MEKCSQVCSAIRWAKLSSQFHYRCLSHYSEYHHHFEKLKKKKKIHRVCTHHTFQLVSFFMWDLDVSSRFFLFGCKFVGVDVDGKLLSSTVAFRRGRLIDGRWTRIWLIGQTRGRNWEIVFFIPSIITKPVEISTRSVVADSERFTFSAFKALAFAKWMGTTFVYFVMMKNEVLISWKV